MNQQRFQYQIKDRLWKQVMSFGHVTALVYCLLWAVWAKVLGVRLLSDPLLTGVSVAFFALVAIRFVQGWTENRGTSSFTRKPLWVVMTSIGCAAFWAFFTSYALIFSGLTPSEETVMLVIVAGIVAGQAYSLAPLPVVSFSSSAITLFVPVGIWCGMKGWDVGGSLLIMASVYFIFLTKQSRTNFDLTRSVMLNSEHIRREKDLVSGILDAVPGFVSVIDENFIYRNVNRVGREFLALQDPVGKTVGFSGENEEFVRILSDFKGNSKDLQTTELKVRLHHVEHWFFISMKKIQDPFCGIVIVSIPIDELKKTQALVEEQTAKAEYSSRLAAIGEMAAGIAHEINNPLAVIGGRALQIEKILSKEAIDREMAQKHLANIQTTVNRISKIVRGLRTFAKDGAHDQPERIQIRALIEDTLSFCESKFKSASVDLRVLLDFEGEVEVRSVQISQVILNLLSNAFDAIQGQENAWVQLQVQENGEHIDIFIRDSGKGIPVSIQEKMMQPFFTTKEVGKGTGLGLSISRGIVESHQGQFLYVPESPNTTFMIRLPKESPHALKRAS